jgi:hypothetical protein
MRAKRAGNRYQFTLAVKDVFLRQSDKLFGPFPVTISISALLGFAGRDSTAAQSCRREYYSMRRGRDRLAA